MIWEDFHAGGSELGGHAIGTRRRGRPSAQEIILKLMHENEDLKRQNAELRSAMAEHFYVISAAA